MLESNVSNIVIVANSSFYLAKNNKELEDLDISYMIPLKRNSQIILYSTGNTHPGVHKVMPFRNDFLKARRRKTFSDAM